MRSVLMGVGPSISSTVSMKSSASFGHWLIAPVANRLRYISLRAAAKNQTGSSKAAQASILMKVLVDTSIWVEHLNNGDPDLRLLLKEGKAVTHEMVIGEIACGSLKERSRTLASMDTIAAIPTMTSRRRSQLSQMTAEIRLNMAR